jgi:hypothetical protein
MVVCDATCNPRKGGECPALSDIPVAVAEQVSAEADALPVHAYTGRVDGATALRCNRQRHRHLPRPDG